MVQNKETESDVTKKPSDKKANAAKAPAKAKASKAKQASDASQAAPKPKKARSKREPAGKAKSAAKTGVGTSAPKKGKKTPSEGSLKQEQLSLLVAPSDAPTQPATNLSEAEKAATPAAQPEQSVPPKEALAPAKAQETLAPAQTESKAQAPSEEQEAPAAVKHEQTEDAPAGEEAKAGPAHKPEPSQTPADAPLGKNKAEQKVSIQLKPNPDGSKLTPVTPRPMIQGNPYKPMAATVAEVIRETPNIVTVRVVLDDPEMMKNFTYEPGQVGQLSVFGVGESTFVINTPPSQKEYIQFSVMRAGEVTTAIHGLSKGDKVGVRAPLGRPFPYELWKGKDVFFIGGGIGMAPIRTIMLHLLENKQDFGKISLLYGGRSPQDLAFSYELDNWMERPDLDCTLTIDREAPNWPHRVGLIPNVLRELKPNPNNCIAVLCGPPIMIKFTLQALDELGFDHENVYTTLEKRMKCGIGICGRCGIGGKYVCLDGPVFSQKELDMLPPEL